MDVPSGPTGSENVRATPTQWSLTSDSIPHFAVSLRTESSVPTDTTVGAESKRYKR